MILALQIIGFIDGLLVAVLLSKLIIGTNVTVNYTDRDES